MKRFGWFSLLLITLIGFQTAVAQSGFMPGDKVIFVARNSSVYTSATSTDTSAGEISRGVVTQIMQIDAAAKRIYLIDHAYGWVDATVDGQPSLVPYDETTLKHIEDQAKADMAARPNDIAPYVTAALIADENGDTHNPVYLLSLALAQSPNDGYLLYQRGKVELNVHAWEDANQNLQAAIAANYKNASVYNCLGIAAEGLDDRLTAISQFHQAINVAGDWGLLYNNLANQYGALQQFQDAIDNYTTAIQLDPLLGTAYRNRSNQYQKIQNYDAAFSDINTSIQLAPFEPRGYVNRADFYANIRGDYDSSFADYDKALSIDPDYELAYVDRAVTYIYYGDVNGALSDLKKVVSLNPNNVDARFNLASLYGRLGLYNQALTQYTAVINFNEDHAYSALLYRPQLYFVSGDYASALNDLNTFIDGGPSDYFASVAFIERAVSYAHEGDYILAMDDLINAQNVQGDFTRAYAQYGSGYQVTPQRVQDLAQLEAKAASDPTDSQTQFELGLLAMQFGEWQVAYDSFAQYGTLTNITDTDFKSFLGELQELIR